MTDPDVTAWQPCPVKRPDDEHTDCPGCHGVGAVPLRDHPATFSHAILAQLKLLIRLYAGLLPDTHDHRQGRRLKILDTHAGTGRVHELACGPEGHFPGIITVGNEIEPEWAAYHDDTMFGDAADLQVATGEFDMVVTSVDYGNRMADHHNPSPEDTSKRYGYAYQLGRMPDQRSSCTHFFGATYRSMHQARHREAIRAVGPGCLVVYNVSNFLQTVRKGQPPKLHRVVDFHLNSLQALGCNVVAVTTVDTPRMRNGANAEARVPYEHIIIVQTPTERQGRLL